MRESGNGRERKTVGETAPRAFFMHARYAPSGRGLSHSIITAAHCEICTEGIAINSVRVHSLSRPSHGLLKPSRADPDSDIAASARGCAGAKP
jgi:hypothetical protein